MLLFSLHNFDYMLNWASRRWLHLYSQQLFTDQNQELCLWSRAWHKVMTIFNDVLDYVFLKIFFFNWFQHTSSSIGSLGKYHSSSKVHDILVDGAFLSNTDNGLRIKTWQVIFSTSLSQKCVLVKMDELMHWTSEFILNGILAFHLIREAVVRPVGSSSRMF